MKLRAEHVRLGGVSALLLLAALLDQLVRHQSLPHTGLALGLGAGTAWIAWRLAARTDLLLAATAVYAAWAFLVVSPDAVLAAAFVPSALLLYAPPHRGAEAGVAALLAAFVAALLLPLGWVSVLVAAGVSGAVTLLRPVRPTAGTLHALRGGSLFLPALLLAASLAWNAATGFGETRQAREAILFGLALFLIFAIVSIALLGLSTLLETSEPFQQNAWDAAAVLAACVAASVASLRDPSRALELLSLSGPLVSVLGALLLLRVRAARQPARLPQAAAPAIPEAPP